MTTTFSVNISLVSEITIQQSYFYHSPKVVEILIIWISYPSFSYFCFLLIFWENGKMIIFCKYQSGFRNNHSTELFLSFLNGKTLKGFDNRVYTGIILTDLQKAFDTINHKILLDKLLSIGFSKNTISWYESYLAESHFTVEVANRVSKFSNILCRVAQGSIVGPLLFLIYVNDVRKAV